MDNEWVAPQIGAVNLIRVSVANNKPLRIDGTIDARIQVGGIDEVHTFLVAPDARWNVILGCHFLRAKR